MDYKIPYNRQSISQDDINAVVSVLKSDYLTQGPKTEEFEQALCDYTGAKYCVVCSSGTAALYMAARAIEIDLLENDFAVPAITFIATASALKLAGARIRACDIKKDSLMIDANDALHGYGISSLFIVPVDYTGTPNYDYEFKPIIADAAHSLGATWKYNNVGTLAGITATSFHAIKTLTSAGEGGACFTDIEGYYKKLKQLRDHGRDSNGLVTEPSFNFRMTEMQAALGISQLKRIDEFIAKRKAIYDRYVAELPEIEFLKVPEYCTSSYHLVVMKHDKRDEIKKYLAGKGIQAQINYIPLTDHPLYADQAVNCPVAIEESKKILSLPCYVDMTEYEQEYVIKSIREALNHG